jgi:signal transduction histidine kinase
VRLLPKRFSASFSGYTAVALFLLTTLALAGWLGYQAFDAAAAERRTAEAVLRDYAGIAAVEFVRFSRTNVHDLLDEVFEDAPRRNNRRDEPWTYENVREYLEDAVRDEGCRCPLMREPLSVFRIDPVAGVIESPPARLSATARERVRLLTTIRDSTFAVSYEALATAPAGEVLDEAVAIAYVLHHDDDGAIYDGFGFIVPIAAIGELLEEWYRERRLLPQPIAGDQPNDSLLHVRAEAPSGMLVFASPTQYPTNLATSGNLGSRWGDITVLAAIRPDAAEQLIIGGLPSSRIPLLAILLLLTLGVGTAAVVHLRREQRFQELREDFVSGVSHELRTPLAQIRIFAELQESGRLTSEEDRKRAIAVIHRESRRLSHLVENILQFSKLRRSPIQGMPREEIDLTEALADGIDAVTPLIADRGMELTVEVTPDLRIMANRDALTRILVNLLDNAAKYGPEGQTVRVRTERVGGSARLSVSDAGPGVPVPDRVRVWKAYRRLERDVHAKIPGTGIGLSVVAELAGLHGGTSWVEDASGGGARFVVEFPVRPSTVVSPREVAVPV